MDGVNSLVVRAAHREPIPAIGDLSGMPLPSAPIRRLLQVFSSILRYNRLGAKCEASHGGLIPTNDLQDLLMGWSREVLPLLRLEVERLGCTRPLQTPTLFVGNHLSYLDIPVLMSQVPVVFLGKEEINRWPVLGAAGRRAGMVFVKRESDGSRRQAIRAISECLQTRGMSLGLFPSGTTSRGEECPWRTGAFRIAKEGGFPVQPFRLTYDPMDRVVFVGNDLLLPHLFRLLQAGSIRARIEFGEPRLIQDPEAAAHELWAWSRGLTQG